MKQKLTTTTLAFSISLGILGQGASADTKFKDLPNPQSHWAYDTVQWAVEKGLTKGYQDGTFKPNNLITEAEFLSLLLNVYPNVKLTDLKTGHWADKFYEYARQYELPLSQVRNQPITRGLVARLITATFGFDYNQNQSIEYLFEAGLSSGKTGKKTIDDYQPNNNMTRAEALQFIKNLSNVYSSSPKFVGLKPIGGNYTDFLRKAKNIAHQNGFNINLKEQSGDFTLMKNFEQKYEAVKSETVITYIKSTSSEQFSYLYLNHADDKSVIKVSKEMILLIGVPIKDDYLNDVTTVHINGSKIKRYLGDYSVEFEGEREKNKVTIKFRKIK